ncbi:MAG: hypothetical protein VKL39_08720 [Leptolyngbyaceae bacterium]|nr:hypothetical protein [Leptolyngbyaceae bacterium]
MKRLVISGLSTLLLLGATAPVVTAQTSGDDYGNDPMTPSSNTYGGYGTDIRQTEAFNLVSFAYRGQLEDEGIAGYNQLIQDFRTRDVTAEDVVQAGIDNGYLSPAALEDEQYVNAVFVQLESLTIGN